MPLAPKCAVVVSEMILERCKENTIRMHFGKDGVGDTKINEKTTPSGWQGEKKW